MTDRTKREANTRADATRRKPWSPPSRLDAPKPPEGYRQRWIRTNIRGEEDQMNVHAKLREGWEPVRADEYPDSDFSTITEGNHAGLISQVVLILARIRE